MTFKIKLTSSETPRQYLQNIVDMEMLNLFYITKGNVFFAISFKFYFFETVLILKVL